MHDGTDPVADTTDSGSVCVGQDAQRLNQKSRTFFFSTTFAESDIAQVWMRAMIAVFVSLVGILYLPFASNGCFERSLT